MDKLKLTPHFSYAEMIVSDYATRNGVRNEPPTLLMPALINTAEGLERVRVAVGKPVVVISGYRCLMVNHAVGGSNGSQHLRAEAADIRCPGMTPSALAQAILANASQIDFDQLILEHPEAFGWVHVSFAHNRLPRRSVLTKRRDSGFVTGLQP